LRPYQHGALRYLHYTQRKRDDALLHYRHLLFHMATGAGKTMVMAGTILYLFKELGYQNFIFFVHTDAIIQKTRENLLNPQSPKYLFSHELEIDGEKITIAPVDIFPSVPERNTIYLKLSTIHKMHDELNSYRENSITYEDLKEIPLVLLGDEAHHFNAGTKARGKSKTSPENEEQTWERTIENILDLRPDNRLFEFTATIDLANKDIGQKYRDKVVYQYDLKQFMSDGYSKKVMLLEANQNDSDKMLDAVLLSQYRKLTAADHGITGFKPVILFKSNKIAISKAKQEEFSQLIAAMTPESIRRHLANKKLQLSSDTSIWHKVIQRYANSDLVTVTG
ncbi:DEAD/DEAH box helicase family protein, partial [Salmonella enterica subsp. enterica serovar Derby]|nr:DEAD/DEAH box helicase family protein [Salmonella enterica subsp. enterica serovar Derby]